MFTLEEFTNFLGWCTLLNIIVLVFSALMLVLMKDCVAKIHANMFGLEQGKLPMLYFQYLGNYKIIIIAFNLVPYIALRMML